MREFPEGNIQKLTDQLKVVRALKNKRSEENCINCGQRGHLSNNCWGICPACGEPGHNPGSCQLSPEKIKAREKRKKKRKRNANRKRLKLKLYKTKSDTNLPEDESNSKFWADSLSDGETVIDMNNTEDSMDESSDEGTAEEVMEDASVSDIISAIERI